ncbi:fibropellin-1 isoform X5 [Strongylocentrotus purpuratus]|uniref:Uromodulin n=1 Tax=Strongylocentrotus purpuratus TaxID=7668 RepID=A0A7M7T2J5_STRPU|nr:fibropellin-1 isoform X5 [Strongylocentrotus purpuratus]
MRGIPVSSLVLLMLSFLCVHNVEAQSTNGTVPIAAILNDPVPLGLESYAIPDSSMTASTEYSANHGARSARSSNANQWIQMDLLDRYKIISVATQGRQDSDQWVQSYKLACSTDGTTFHTVQGISTNPGADRIFTGNSDRNTIVTNTLPVPQFCRYIRLMPVSWYGQISLRMQIFREDINECSPDPCENGGRCSDGVDSFTCACAPGYTGPTCGTDNNECSPDPCENGGRCSDGVDSFTCACAPGYTGPTCGTDINECSPDPCENGGRCSDGANTFTCACAPGYTGPTCGTDNNECSPDPCENGGRCSDGVDSFTCACAPGYTGPTCGTDINECSPDPCENGGRCSDGVDSFTCACAPGYTGSTCGTDINECSLNPCENGGTCSDGVNIFTCACAPGYTGPTCVTDINECSPDPCENGGRCSDGVDSFTCACAPGYTGPTCGTDIDECSPNPCENGGTCSDGVNTFTCACAPGYTGPTCGTDIDECSPNPCENGGTCSDGVNTFTCACAPGYTGPTCVTDINECSPDPCENGGTCSDGMNTFTCACAPGYTGPTCLTDINDCSPDPCENGGTCSDGANTFTCACAPGYTGTTCGTDINDCSPDPCENGGTCSDGVNTFTCACAPGYTGTTCGTDINECSPDPCENGGTCSDGMNTFTCACAPGYTGPTCLTDINDCSPDPCENGGTCSDGVNTFTCACAPGYTGTTCRTAILNDPRPLGLESYVIPDSSMTASSEESADHGAKRGRLNVRKVKTLRGAWSARSNNANQWIQVDLLDLYRINSVATQGRQAYNQWVTSYKLACSTDGTTFHTVQGISINPGADRIFTGNSDRNTIVTNTLPVPQMCRYVRLMPVRWFGHISLRMEIYGEGPITDINDCSPDPCENGGTCIDGVDTFTCACAPGYIGPTCGTAARVTCDSSSMTVFISKTLNILPADLHFIDESCVGYNPNGENIALYSRYDKCKFTTEENSDFIIYSNVISTTVTDNTPNGSVITRVMGETLINVRCQIRRRQVLSRFYNPISSSLKIDEVGYGNFTVDFERYTDENFRERHPNEAAPVRIQDRLFYAVSLTSVSNLTLFIDHCWSTPSSDPLDTKQYDLIKDGCASDDTVQTISTFGPSFKPFTFDAFTFIGDYSQVYVHCEVVACNEGDTNSICAQGCLAPALPLPARLRRSVVGKPVGTNSQPRIVSQIVGPFVKGSEKQGVTAKTGWASPYIFLASLAAGACLFIGMIAMYAVMKARM